MQTKESKNTSQKEEQGLQQTAESSSAEKAEQSLEDVLSTAATGAVSDLSLIEQKLNEATPAEIANIAQNSALMQSLSSNLPAGEVKNHCLDAFEPHIADTTTLTAFIKGRFDVTMGKDNSQNCQSFTSLIENPSQNYTAKPWTIEALHRAYHNLEKLPEWQVELVNNVTTCQTTNGGGGVAAWWLGCYNVDYADNPNQANDLAGQDAAAGAVVTNEDYFRRGLCSFDVTFTHELGHIVDQGGRFSSLPDFMDISGWKSEGNDPNYIAPKIISEIDGDPYPSDMTPTEIKVGNDAAVMIVHDQVDACKESAIEQLVTIAAYNLPSMDDVRPIEYLVKRLVRSNAYYTLARSFAVSRDFGYDYPCYNEPTRTVKMKRYVHEGYTNGGYYSYDSAARAFKISDYQYRNPGEEFAELYAAYHVSGGQNVGDKHKDWFEKMGLHKNDPQQTAIQVGLSRSTGQKEEGQKDN